MFSVASWVCWLLFALCIFFFKQKTAYEMRISDWSSDVCSSDLIVVGQSQREVGQRLGHARRGRYAEGQRAAAGLDQERVAVAVVAALELDDACPSGGAAREPDRRQRRLGARVDHADRKSTRLNSSH